MSVHWLGYVGTGLVIVAYLPQITHLVWEHCSAGVSSWAYLMWGVAAILLLSYAIAKGDPVFTALQIYQVVATVAICLLSRHYRDSLCEDHGGRGGASATEA
jgi:lipid-A-disaccharide synthase-like uncharacterized protein